MQGMQVLIPAAVFCHLSFDESGENKNRLKDPLHPLHHLHEPLRCTRASALIPERVWGRSNVN